MSTLRMPFNGQHCMNDYDVNNATISAHHDTGINLSDEQTGKTTARGVRLFPGKVCHLY